LRKQPLIFVLFIVILPLVVTAPNQSQTPRTKAQTPIQRLIVQAKDNADAIVTRDYEAQVLYTYPAIIHKMGGFEKALAFVKASMEEIYAKGLTIDRITIGQPSAIIKEGQEDVAIVPTEMAARIEGKQVKVNSYLVAVSQDKGKTWYFLDVSSLPKEKLRQAFPKLTASVDIPEHRNSLADELNKSLRQWEEKEGKPIQQILDARVAESKHVIKRITDNGLRLYVERREGKKLEQISTTRLRAILKELKIE
jgi:hypothetical protein